MTFYLINTVTVGTVLMWAGTLIDEAQDNITNIEAAGGVLVTSSNSLVASAALRAQALRARGGQPQEAADIMQAALDQTDKYDRKGADLGDADAPIDMTGGDWRVLPAATLSANRQLTLNTTKAVKGDQITVTRLDLGAFTYALVNGGPGAGTLVTLPVSKAGFALCEFDGTNWVLRQAGSVG